MNQNTIKLDLKDKKLLLELDMNARNSYSELAKRVKMSKQGVEYKINNLIKKGVIKGYYPIINMSRLGFKYCRLALKFQNLTAEREKEIFSFIKDHPKIGWAIKIEGLYDIGLGIWAKSIIEFKEVVDDLVYTFGSNISKKVESIGIKVHHYEARYLLGKKTTKEIIIDEDDDLAKLDNLDFKILDHLCEDARMSLVDMAESLSVSAKVISYHIKRMEKQKILEGYRAIVDHSLLGFNYFKVLINLSNLSKKAYSDMKNYLKIQPEVNYFIEALGWKDLDFEMYAASNQEFFRFMRKLKMNFPLLIKDEEILIFTDTIKVSYLPEI